MMYREGTIQIVQKVIFKAARTFDFRGTRYKSGQVVELPEQDAQMLARNGFGHAYGKTRQG